MPGDCQVEAMPARGLTPAPTPVPKLGGSLFHEPWWLTAVSAGRFEEATVTSGQQIVGRFPYMVSRKMGLTEVRMPPFTHVLGPAVDAGIGKAQTQLMRRLSIVRELLGQVPRFDFFKHALSSLTADGLAFQDCGFHISPQYTFQIDCRREPDELWQEMHFKVRQHIRRAEEKFSVVAGPDPGEFVRFYLDNLIRARQASRINFDPFQAMFEACSCRDSGEILAVRWPDGRPVAMAFVVWGHGTMYYLLSTRASDSGDNGSVNLLIWSAMLRAHGRGLVLDLDGVSSSGTARFLGGFGGRLETRLIAQRSRFLYGTLQSAKRRLIPGHANKTLAFT